MNRIISINIQGLVFQIEEDAFEHLDAYLRKLRNHFTGQDGVDEILADIESRIAEMLSRNPGLNGAVNLQRVKEIISQMGDPSEFENEESSENTSTSSTYTKNKRVLYRDPENRWLGGVCSGLSSYFDIDTIWIRILFLFAFLTFGTGFLLYILLWILIPEAKTPSERLEMKGEKVTIDNIEKTVREEFDRFRRDFDSGKMADNARSVAGQASKVMITGIGVGLKALLRVIGFFMVSSMLVLIIVSGFAYFGLITDLWSIPIFPFFHQLFENDSIAIIYEFCIALLFIVPIAGVLYLGMRLLLGLSSGNRWIGRTLSGLWVFAFVGVIIMIFHLSDSWRDHATISQEQSIPASDTLFIESNNIAVYDQKEFEIEFGRSRGIRGIYARENGFLKRPVGLNIQVSNIPTMLLKEQKHANGNSHQQASELASHIQHDLQVTSGKLVFNPYFNVPETDVWKNQHLVYDLFIPIGTVVVFGSNVATFLEHVSTDTYIDQSRLEGKAFIMTAQGLKIDEKTLSEQSSSNTYPYSNFTDISITGLPELVVYESDHFTVSSDDKINFTPEFIQHGSVLEINLPPAYIGRAKGRIHIGLPKLQRLEVNGGSRVSLRLPKQDDFRIELNGAANVEGEVHSDKFTLETNGINYCQIKGSSRTFKMEVNGSGEFDLLEMRCDEAKIEANGTGKIKVHVNNKLKVEANGASHISYSGEPADTSFEMNGGSTIAHANH